MFTIFDHPAAMDTDGRSSAWFDYPQSTYFPAFRGTSFPFKAPETFPDLPGFNNHNLSSMVTANTDTCASSNSNMLNRPSPTTPIYKMYLKEIMQGRGSSKVQFRHQYGTDMTVKNGTTLSVPFRYQTLTAMPEYQDQSFEEIRLEDYIRFSVYNNEEDTDARLPGSSLVKEPLCEPPQRLKPIEILSQPPLLNTLLQNIANQKNTTTDGMNNESAATSNDPTFDILQTLMSNVKQRFDVNYLSEGAKRSCAALTHALAEYTEKTLENLTVIVLEDILHNIKQQKVDSPRMTADKYTSTCPCSENSSRGENHVERSRTKNAPQSKKCHDNVPASKYEDDYSSDCQALLAEDRRSVFNEPEHRCEGIEKTNKTGRKKVASVPATFGKTLSWVTRSARHSYNGSGRPVDKVNRHKGQHRKLSDEKYNSFREKSTYNDSDHDECVNRNNESKHSSGNRDDGWVTISKAKHQRDSFRRKKKSPKKVQQIVMHDECRVCESLGRVSINECTSNRKEYIAIKEKTAFPRFKERVYEATEDHADDEVEDERQRADKGGDTSSKNVDESGVTPTEFELQSYSDSSSI